MDLREVSSSSSATSVQFVALVRRSRLSKAGQGPPEAALCPSIRSSYCSQRRRTVRAVKSCSPAFKPALDRWKHPSSVPAPVTHRDLAGQPVAPRPPAPPERPAVLCCRDVEECEIPTAPNTSPLAAAPASGPLGRRGPTPRSAGTPPETASGRRPGRRAAAALQRSRRGSRRVALAPPSACQDGSSP